MRAPLFLLAACLITSAIALGAIACSDDDDDGDDQPTATEEAAGTPSDGETPQAGAVDVSLLEFQVVSDPESTSAGEVTFNANNLGAEIHELVVIKTDLAPDALPTTEDGAVDEAGEGIDVIGEIEEFAAGTEESAAFELDAGSYVLICNVTEEEEDGTVESHYAEGMRAAFVVN